MLQRLRDAFMSDDPPAEFHSGGEFQVDEAYIGGLESNKHSRNRIPGGRGGAAKMIVICIAHVESVKVWADVIPDTRADTIADIVHRIVPSESTLYTDDGRHYRGINGEKHAVNHSRREYARMVDLIEGISGDGDHGPC